VLPASCRKIKFGLGFSFDDILPANPPTFGFAAADFFGGLIFGITLQGNMRLILSWLSKARF
jgi:hypothetical protein